MVFYFLWSWLALFYLAIWVEKSDGWCFLVFSFPVCLLKIVPFLFGTVLVASCKFKIWMSYLPNFLKSALLSFMLCWRRSSWGRDSKLTCELNPSNCRFLSSCLLLECTFCLPFPAGGRNQLQGGSLERAGCCWDHLDGMWLNSRSPDKFEGSRGQDRDVLIWQLPKITLHCTFPSLLNPPPASRGWPASSVSACPLYSVHIVHGVPKARILKGVAIPFSRGPCFVRALHPDPCVLGGPAQHGSWFHWVRQDCSPCE